MKKNLMILVCACLLAVLAISAVPLMSSADLRIDDDGGLECCNYHNECTSGTCGPVTGCSAGADRKCA